MGGKSGCCNIPRESLAPVSLASWIGGGGGTWGMRPDIALDSSECIEILPNAGYLSTHSIVMVRFDKIPVGLDAAELERFLKENGAELCGPRNDVITASQEEGEKRCGAAPMGAQLNAPR